MITQCCMCKRVRTAGVWEVALQPLAEKIASGQVEVSHGYCPTCKEVAELEMLEDLNATKQEPKQ